MAYNFDMMTPIEWDDQVPKILEFAENFPFSRKKVWVLGRKIRFEKRYAL